MVAVEKYKQEYIFYQESYQTNTGYPEVSKTHLKVR